MIFPILRRGLDKGDETKGTRQRGTRQSVLRYIKDNKSKFLIRIVYDMGITRWAISQLI